MDLVAAVAAVIAAFAAAAGLAAQWYWRRPVLEFAFNGWSPVEADGRMRVGLEVRNVSDATAENVRAVGRIAGAELVNGRLGPWSVRGHEWDTFRFPVRTPEQAVRGLKGMEFPAGPVDAVVHVGRRSFVIAYGETKRLGRIGKPR